MNIAQTLGIIGVLALFVTIGVLSGRSIKSASDFVSGGGKGSASSVAGVMLGTVIGGASTIGTAQLAYDQGLSAWWYTLSCGLSCLVFALLFTKPFRHMKENTLIGAISQEYGAKAGMVSSLLYSLSILLTLVAQILSATALLPFVFPSISSGGSILLTAALMMAYIVFGGTLSAARVGKLKTLLLYLAALSGAFIVLQHTDLNVLQNTLDRSVYFDLFALGVGKESSKALSVIMGIITAQAFLQAIRMGRSDRAAAGGAVISAILTPPIGLCSVLIGMFMRVSCPDLELAKYAFPRFVLMYMPDWLGGIVMGTLFLALIGSGAGAVLGGSVILAKDVIQPLSRRTYTPKTMLWITRLCIAVILTLGSLMGSGILGDVILTFGSMGATLRASVIFMPLVCALALPGRIEKRWIMASTLFGAITVPLASTWDALPFDSFFAGVLVSSACCLLGLFASRRTLQRKQN